MNQTYFYLVLLFGIFGQQFNAVSQTNNNAELQKMYDEDQGGRKVAQINWRKLSQDDSLRERRVYELIKEGKVVTGKDYYNTAMIFQHGRDTVASTMAVKQMRKALELDSTINRWLLAAAIDRDLMRKNKPQIYGTQFRKMFDDDKYRLYTIDTTQVTDKERIYYHVETLAEQKVKERNMNLLKITDFYAKSNSIEQTIDLIKSEKKKGLAGVYNVGEGPVNALGYALMEAKKLDDALAIFKLNIKYHPKSGNTYDSLGECLLLMNKKRKGIKAYKKALALDPKNDYARKIINETK
jgi:tetratricopeptide (TPR) repeat protein